MEQIVSVHDLFRSSLLWTAAIGNQAMLTRKQFELLRFIHERLKEAGVPPSFDEMKDALDLRSKSGIHRLITALEERGFIRRLPNRARALEVVKLPEMRPSATATPIRPVAPAPANDTIEIPLHGRIAAGTPIEAPRRRKRLSVASSSSISATTMSPVSAASVFLMSAVSPSRMPASIIESPRTSKAK